MTSQGSTSCDVTVVIDVGTGYVRGGIAGEDTPRCELSTLQSSPVKERAGKEYPTPINRGCVKDWDTVESLLRTVYSSLDVDPDSQHALLLTRHVQDPVTDADKFVQLAVEKLGASAVYLGSQPVLTLYANGCTDGVVVDCGEGVTQVVPVYQGYTIDHAIRRQDLAGRDVSLRLQTLLATRRPNTVQGKKSGVVPG
ncbi:actin, cytoplasmic-like [Littorina saxatilis]|uniref:actin, cytoplasmic-like n=1 Tax=Littorina saxatilis TaxID=31220 RepID=UPI0038B6082D